MSDESLQSSEHVDLLALPFEDNSIWVFKKGKVEMNINIQNLDDVLQLGEGQYIEFKESLDKSFAKEIVAFANASGGIIYLGITDSCTKKDFGKRSEARNRLLADLLSRTDFMEKAGTGIQRVKDACSSNGNKILFDFTDSFWVTIETNKNDNVPDHVPDNVPDNRLKIIIKYYCKRLHTN